MKKTYFLIACAALLAACSSAPKSVGINAMPVKLGEAITAADRTAEKVQKVWEKQCANAPCTREMCYVQIDPVCESNICVGKLKTLDSYK